MHPVSLPALNRSLAPSGALFSGLAELPKASCIPELGTAFSYTDSAVKSMSSWPSFLALRLTPMITPE